MDIAQKILSTAEGLPNHKALAQHFYEIAPHEHALADMLRPLQLDPNTKADLWDAKRYSVNDPKITRLHQIAKIDKSVLDVAEMHPNVMKHLMEMDKPKEGAGKPGQGGESKPGGAKSLGAIEIKAAEPKEE